LVSERCLCASKAVGTSRLRLRMAGNRFMILFV
jgi:hypothetical protein